jgi:hypothetical protein
MRYPSAFDAVVSAQAFGLYGVEKVQRGEM